MPKINRTDVYPITDPALTDFIPGSDADADNATVNFLLSAILALFQRRIAIDVDDDLTGRMAQFGGNNIERYIEISGDRARFGYVGGRVYIGGGTGKGVQVEVDNGVLALRVNADGSLLCRRGSPIDWVASISGTTPVIAAVEGGLRTWTLSGNSTPTVDMPDGARIRLMIRDGAGYTIDWSSAVDHWIGGSAPTLSTTQRTVIDLFSRDSTVHGHFIGYTD